MKAFTSVIMTTTSNTESSVSFFAMVHIQKLESHTIPEFCESKHRIFGWLAYGFHTGFLSNSEEFGIACARSIYYLENFKFILT